MATDLEICNLALVQLGLEPIGDLSDATQNARTCDSLYPYVRDSYIQEYNWSFRKRMVELTSVDEAILESFGLSNSSYPFGYAYPSECFKALKIKDAETNAEYPFIIRDVVLVDDNVVILTTLEDAWLECIASIIPPTDFTPIFTDALSKKLAYSISWSLTKDLKIQKQALEQFALADQNAKYHDSSQRMPEPNPLTWEQVRHIPSLYTGGLYPYWR